VIGNAEQRAEILAQHARLRRTVHALLDTAARVQGGHASGGEMLWEQFATLRFELAQHLLDEEDLLEPVFARADGTGAPLLARMNLEHARQRAELSALPSRRPRDQVGLHAFAASAAAIGRALLVEMEEEEQQLLSLEALGQPAIPRSGSGTV
jgi:iron-sulfur cluster repair protein YtfE (RIC family)